MESVKAVVIENIQIAKDTYKMSLRSEIAAQMQPGQFVNVQVSGFYLRRPISICEVVDKQHFVIIYKVVGDGTKKLSQLPAGHALGVLGPLGSGYPINDAQSVFYADEFAALGCAVHVATMDGSAGVKGTVIDAIDAAGIQTDFVCSCGPVPMLKAVEARYSRGYMSFESRMACGIGACMACVAKDRKEADLYHRICKEGPVFPIGKVEF